MMRFLLILISIAALMSPRAEPHFTADWESLKAYACPEWFRDAKFGIFLHWGVNSVPAWDGHYGKYMYYQDQESIRIYHKGVYEHHAATYGHPSEFGYKDFIPMWKAEKWDPDALVRYFKENGARYIVPVAVHHDNFANYASKMHRWNSVEMGPKRDILGDWKTAIEEHGLRFGASTHLGRAPGYYARARGADIRGPLKGVPYDGANPELADFYLRDFDEKVWTDIWINRTKEIIDLYQPDLLWFDGALPGGDRKTEIIAHFYNGNINKYGGRLEAVLNLKEQFEPGTVVHDIEKGQATELRDQPWQTDTTINSGWFYQTRRYGHGYEMPDSDLYMDEAVLIDNLVDIVSKNGNMLLNVGLRADGTLPEDQAQVLTALGDWFRINGEAIFDTRPWHISGEGPTKLREDGYNTEPRDPWPAGNLRFTVKGDTLYVLAMEWPGEELLVKTLKSGAAHPGGKITSVELLGHDGKLEWHRDKSGLHITLPPRAPTPHAHAFRVRGFDRL